MSDIKIERNGQEVDPQKTTVIGGVKESKQKIPGENDPAWLKAVKDFAPENLTFHALIRAIYRETKKTAKNEQAARAKAIIEAARKIFRPDERAHIVQALEDGDLRKAIAANDGLIKDDEGFDVEQDVMDSFEEDGD